MKLQVHGVYWKQTGQKPIWYLINCIAKETRCLNLKQQQNNDYLSLKTFWVSKCRPTGIWATKFEPARREYSSIHISIMTME